MAERLLVIQPENFALGRKAAVRYLERQNPRAALAKLQACYNADAKDPETLGLLANTFAQLGQADKTLSVLKQLAKVYEDRRMGAERSQTIQRILQLDPSDPLGGRVARPDAIRPTIDCLPGAGEAQAARPPGGAHHLQRAGRPADPGAAARPTCRPRADALPDLAELSRSRPRPRCGASSPRPNRS